MLEGRLLELMVMAERAIICDRELGANYRALLPEATAVSVGLLLMRKRSYLICSAVFLRPTQMLTPSKRKETKPSG